LTKPAQVRRKELKVTVRFEPNRLSDQFLATAYELVVPIREEDTSRRRKQEKKQLQSGVKQKKVGNLDG
jgi:hypothetical protein